MWLQEVTGLRAELQRLQKANEELLAKVSLMEAKAPGANR